MALSLLESFHRVFCGRFSILLLYEYGHIYWAAKASTCHGFLNILTAYEQSTKSRHYKPRGFVTKLQSEREVSQKTMLCIPQPAPDANTKRLSCTG